MSISRNHLDAAIGRGQAWLNQNAKRFVAETENGLRFQDQFLELLLLEITGNWNLVNLRIPQGKWNYFGGETVGTVGVYPPDIDTSAVASTVIRPVDATIQQIADEMLAAENEDGIIPLYFDDKSRPRVCVETCANVCTFFYMCGRGHEIQKTFDFVLSTLESRDFEPKRYYPYIEPLLFYVSRLTALGHPGLDRLRKALRSSVEERIGMEANTICLAMRLIVCQQFGLANTVDLQTLLSMQKADGSFGLCWLYRFGRSQEKIGHQGLTCALAVEVVKRALQA